MASVQHDYLLAEEVMHNHLAGDITDLTATLDPRYVNVTGDTMTGGLTIQPATDTLTALVVNDKDTNNVLTVDTINNRVGIGTTATQYALSLLQSSADYKIGSYSDSTHYGYILPFEWTTGDFVFDHRQTSTGGYDFRYAGSSQMRITTGGNVGIGTASPGAIIHAAISNSASPVALFERTTASTGALGITFGSGISTLASTNDFRIYTGSSGGTGGNENLRITTAGNVGIGGTAASTTPILYVGANGNVGIGTTSPEYKIQVYDSTSVSTFTGTTKAGLALGTYGIDNYNTINFYNPVWSTNPGARISGRQGSSGSYLEFGTSNNYANGITNTALTINPSGNVGIGTTSPGSKLEINGDQINKYSPVLGQGGTYLKLQNTNSDPNTYADHRVTLILTGSNYAGTSTLWSKIGTENGNLSLSTQDGWIGITPGNSSYVGIRKSYPSFPVDISGTTRIDVGNLYINGTDQKILVHSTGDTSNGMSFSAGNGNLSGTINVTRSNGPFYLQQGGVNRMTVDDSGNISLNSGQLYVQQSSGNVGIGTTAPAGRLHINGTANDQQLIIEGHSTQTLNLTEWWNSSGTTLAFITPLGGAVFNETGADADLRVEGDTDDNLFFVDASADKIGIGKNNPAYKLDVTGEINATTGYRVNGTAGATGTFTTADAKTVTVTNGIITSIV